MNEVRNYETVLVLQELKQDEQKRAIDSVYKLFEKKGGEVLQREDWGIKELFHQSGKVLRGHFNFIRFNVSCQEIRNITRDLKLNTEVLKFFIAKVTYGK